jgi:hypothetical protein
MARDWLGLRVEAKSAKAIGVAFALSEARCDILFFL